MQTLTRLSDLDHSIVRTVRLAPQSRCAQSRTLSMLISATGHSSSVREVCAYLSRLDAQADADGCGMIATWLAYSIFSRESRHRIRRVVLEHGVGSALARHRIHAILQADDPVAALFPDLACSVKRHRLARLAASFFVLFDPEETAADGAVAPDLTEQPLSELRVLSQTPAWWSVVLPAWGRAWVRPADATITTIAAPPDRYWIPELSVMMTTTDELTQTLAWLAFAGAETTTVKLSGYDRAPTAVTLDWPDVLTAFPKVTHLYIADLQAHALPMIADSNLQSLTLSNVSGARVVETLLDVLASEHHALAQSLTTLVITSTLPDTPQGEILEAARRMLSRNRLLQSFSLTVAKPRDNDTVDYAAMHAAVAVYHDTPIQRHVREMLALVSVALRRDGSALQSVDSGCLTGIFRFAGLCQRRSVELYLREQ